MRTLRSSPRTRVLTGTPFSPRTFSVSIQVGFWAAKFQPVELWKAWKYRILCDWDSGPVWEMENTVSSMGFAVPAGLIPARCRFAQPFIQHISDKKKDKK